MLSKSGIRKNISTVLNTFMMLLMALSLASCSHNEKQKDPDEIEINLVTDSDINPNEYGKPAPLNIFAYNVKSVDTFANSDFFMLTEGNSKQYQDAASKVYDAILQPGESRSIKLKPDSDTRAFGFVAAYRNIKGSSWLTVWNIPAKKKKPWWKFTEEKSVEMTVHFQKAAITITKID